MAGVDQELRLVGTGQFPKVASPGIWAPTVCVRQAGVRQKAEDSAAQSESYQAGPVQMLIERAPSEIRNLK